MKLNEDDLREIFALFCSTTRYERNQIYDKDSGHHFASENLDDVYDLSQEKREYALDAWRAVMYLLYRRGFKLRRNNEEIQLNFADEEFIE